MNNNKGNHKYTKHGEPLAFLYEIQDWPESFGCIIWPYRTDGSKAGYGRITYKNKSTQAHRASLAIATGINPKGMQAGHAAHEVCGNKACVAPYHLQWQTPQQNIAQRSEDGTMCKPRLTKEQVAHILASDATHEELATQYGVSKNAIYKHRRNQRLAA